MTEPAAPKSLLEFSLKDIMIDQPAELAAILQRLG